VNCLREFKKVGRARIIFHLEFSQILPSKIPCVRGSIHCQVAKAGWHRTQKFWENAAAIAALGGCEEHAMN
jgi:hypothetical protein